MITKQSSSSSSKSCFFSCFLAPGNEEERGIEISMPRPTADVDAEYTEAFHSKSFLDMWAQAHHYPKATSSPPSLPDILLDPTQCSLLHSAAAVGGGAALNDYLDATLQSFAACADLLDAIHRTRSHHRAVKTLLLRLHGGAASSSADLAVKLDLGNPLSSKHLSRFHRAHALFEPLLARLSAEQRRLRCRARVLRAAETAAIAVVGAAAVTAVMMAAGGMGRRWASLRRMERAGRRAEAAARGAYIVWRDMETVSRMVRRVHDEVEHRRDEVKLVLMSGAGGCAGGGGMVREVVREMEGSEEGFQEQIEELEEHVFLCLLTINRSRRLVAEEMAGDCEARRRWR